MQIMNNPTRLIDGIAKLLDDERIFSMEIVEGGVEFMESCDYYFSHTLTREQFKQFIQECVVLLNKLPQEDAA